MVVPHWDRILDAAVRLADGLEMGYVGIDFVLDEHRGPLVLEANARPGLSIQLANRTALFSRLQAIEAQIDCDENPAVTNRIPDGQLLPLRTVGGSHAKHHACRLPYQAKAEHSLTGSVPCEG